MEFLTIDEAVELISEKSGLSANYHKVAQVIINNNLSVYFYYDGYLKANNSGEKKGVYCRGYVKLDGDEMLHGTITKGRLKGDCGVVFQGESYIPVYYDQENRYIDYEDLGFYQIRRDQLLIDESEFQSIIQSKKPNANQQTRIDSKIKQCKIVIDKVIEFINEQNKHLKTEKSELKALITQPIKEPKTPEDYWVNVGYLLCVLGGCNEKLNKNFQIQQGEIASNIESDHKSKHERGYSERTINQLLSEANKAFKKFESKKNI